MSDSYRLTVLKRLTNHLRGITVMNGYEFNVANAVFRGRSLFGENDPVPLLSILESPKSDQGLFSGEARSEKWSLLIQGWALDDVLNPTDPVYPLMQAVEHRLARLIAVGGNTGYPTYPDEYLLGRSVGDVEVLPGVVRPPDQQSSKAFFYLPIRVLLVRENG